MNLVVSCLIKKPPIIFIVGVLPFLGGEKMYTISLLFLLMKIAYGLFTYDETEQLYVYMLNEKEAIKHGLLKVDTPLNKIDIDKLKDEIRQELKAERKEAVKVFVDGKRV